MKPTILRARVEIITGEPVSLIFEHRFFSGKISVAAGEITPGRSKIPGVGTVNHGDFVTVTIGDSDESPK